MDEGGEEDDDLLDIGLDEEGGDDGPPVGLLDEESEHAKADVNTRQSAEAHEEWIKPLPMRPSSEEVGKQKGCRRALGC